MLYKQNETKIITNKKEKNWFTEEEKIYIYLSAMGKVLQFAKHISFSDRV